MSDTVPKDINVLIDSNVLTAFPPDVQAISMVEGQDLQTKQYLFLHFSLKYLRFLVDSFVGLQ